MPEMFSSHFHKTAQHGNTEIKVENFNILDNTNAQAIYHYVVS